MGGLFGALRASAGAMDAARRALEVSQNNINNASTPGYVRQRVALSALPFEPAAGLAGGVAAGRLESTRSAYAEAAVWERQEAAGYAGQNAAQTAAVEPSFDVTGEAGIPGAISRLFQSLSAIATAPTSAAWSEMLASAQDTAHSFASAAASLGRAAAGAEEQIGETVSQINELAGRIRDYNSRVRQNGALARDAGADAALNAALEELAGLADFRVLNQEDGSVTVLLGGRTPLVMGEENFEVSAELAQGRIDVRCGDAGAATAGGRLGALLDFRNSTLPGWASRLDGLAAELGALINGAIGTPVFSWDAGDAAASLEAGSPAQPRALDGAALAETARTGAERFASVYGSLAADVGRAVQAAQQDSDAATQALLQAREMRAELCGVSLDEEAAYLLEFQRAYEAAARVVQIVDRMLEQTLGITN